MYICVYLEDKIDTLLWSLPSAKEEGDILLIAVHLSLSSTSERFLRDTYKQFYKLKWLQCTLSITLIAQIEEP